MKLHFLSFWNWPVCKGKRRREGAGQLNSSTGFQNLAHNFFQMALKDTKFDSNGVQIANCFQKKKIIARQLGAPPPDPICDAHELTPLCLARRPSATFLRIT